MPPTKPGKKSRRAASGGADAARPAARFGREYYRRYYLDPRTAVVSRAEMRARARLIAAYAKHAGLPVGRILDAGCGIGLLRAPLRRAFPRAEYVGLEASGYLCDRHGWTRGSLATWRARPFDLVVCYDVLQYLDERAAVRALANLGRLCRGVLYFSALTLGDWRDNCDRRRTDGDVFLRSAAWYRTRLSRAFRPAGAGFWLRRTAPLVVWELETS
jgi:2-polyprenyl-3-methyl-5-hydroxy-6-metoxy-1,4-benzoquinol methylase